LKVIGAAIYELLVLQMPVFRDAEMAGTNCLHPVDSTSSGTFCIDICCVKRGDTDLRNEIMVALICLDVDANEDNRIFLCVWRWVSDVYDLGVTYLSGCCLFCEATIRPT
jgi:hypothetical protein